MMREVVGTIVKRTEKFGGTGFQDWKFRIEMAVKGSCGRLHDFMEWAEDQELYIDPVTSVTEENSGYNSNLYCVLAQRTEGEAFDVVKNVAARTPAKHGESLSTIFWKDPRKTTTSHSQMRKSDESQEAQRGHWHGEEVGDEHHAFGGRLEGGALNIMQKGKDKGVEFYGYCNSCGAWGHRAADCPGKTSMRCIHCGQNGHRLSECPVKDAELKGKGRGKFGKGNNKGKGQVKGSDFNGSGKMGSFSNNGHMWNGGYKGKGGKNAGKGQSANGVWEEDVWEDGSGAQTMQPFGVTEDHEKVMSNAWTTVTTSSAHAGRKDRVVPSAPPGLQLQNRFGELVVE